GGEGEGEEGTLEEESNSVDAGASSKATTPVSIPEQAEFKGEETETATPTAAAE
ncbi:unnamed protein product, partial [Amoebophrya sp. A25]